MAATISNSAVDAAGESAALAIVARKTLGEFTLDVRFDVPPGITILFGESGAGKTTVLDCVAGLLTPEIGRIDIGERTLFDSERRLNVPVARRSIGYVLQHLALFPHLRADENIGFGISHLPAAERRGRVDAIVDSFRIRHVRNRKPREMSGGERQRVALARALVIDPCVLLLDEPLSGLDVATRSLLIEDLRVWNNTHRIPVLYVTHSHDEVFALGERVVAIRQGRVMAVGTPHELLETPQQEWLAQVAGIENIFDAEMLAPHYAEGTMTCRLRAAGGTTEIEAPYVNGALAEHGFRLGIRAGDILLATQSPSKVSARNVIRGRVLSTARRDYMVVVQVECGVTFSVHITPAAERELGVTPGCEVWLVIKTHSCHLLRTR